MKPEGKLFLGSLESVTRSTKIFSIYNKKYRIYGRRDFVAPSLPPFVAGNRMLESGAPNIPKKLTDDKIDKQINRIMEKHAPPHLLLDRANKIVRFSGGAAGLYLEPSPGSASCRASGIVVTGNGSPYQKSVCGNWKHRILKPENGDHDQRYGGKNSRAFERDGVGTQLSAATAGAHRQPVCKDDDNRNCALTDGLISPVVVYLMERNIPLIIQTGVGITDELERRFPEIVIRIKPNISDDLVKELVIMIDQGRSVGPVIMPAAGLENSSRMSKEDISKFR